MDTSLQAAIQAIKAGDKPTGRQQLMEILRTDRDNETAWLWLSATVEDPAQRLHCLREVLRINPAHPQALAGLAKLQPPPAPALEPVPGPNPPPPPVEQPRLRRIQPLPEPEPERFEPPAPEPELEPEPVEPPAPRAASSPVVSKVAVPPTGLSWFQVWVSVLSSPTEKSFRFVLADPKLSFERGMVWMAVSILIQYLVMMGVWWLVWVPALERAIINEGLSLQPVIALRSIHGLWWVVGGVIYILGATLLFALQVAFQHLLARYLLRGEGSYEQLFFVSAAYQAPLQLVGMLVMSIPLVNICIGLFLTFYTLTLMVNALRAVYQFGPERAIAVLTLPTLILFLACCFLSIASQGLVEQLAPSLLLTPTP